MEPTDYGDLMEIKLGAGLKPGFDIAWNTRTGRPAERCIDPIEAGWQGIHIRGQGPSQTTIIPDGAGSTLWIGNGAGTVVLEDLCLVFDSSANARGKGIHFGTEHGATSIHDRLILRNVTLLAPDPEPDRDHSAVWGVFTYGVDVDFQDVMIDSRWTAEHAFYAHGFYAEGIRWDHVHVVSSGAEGLKVATRPQEVHYSPQARIHVRNCRFRDWFQPHSWRGGAGMVLQGAGAKTTFVEFSSFYGASGDRAKCLMIDDGQSAGKEEPRYYDHTGVAGGPGAANGWIAVQHSGFHGVGKIPAGTNLVKVDTLNRDWPTEHANARGFLMDKCAMYGANTFLAIAGVPDDHYIVQDCNTDSIQAYAESVGFDTEHESRIKPNLDHVSMGRGNLADDFG